MHIDELPEYLPGRPFVLIVGESHLELGENHGLYAFATYHSPGMGESDAIALLRTVLEGWDSRETSED